MPKEELRKLEQQMATERENSEAIEFEAKVYHLIPPIGHMITPSLPNQSKWTAWRGWGEGGTGGNQVVHFWGVGGQAAHF